MQIRSAQAKEPFMACWQAECAENEIRLFAGHRLPCVWYRKNNVVHCMAICFTFAVSFERSGLLPS